jgi:hypothetical protein
MESSMSKAGLDNRHRNKDGEISGKYGNTLIRTLRKIYGQGFGRRVSGNHATQRGNASTQ